MARRTKRRRSIAAALPFVAVASLLSLSCTARPCNVDPRRPNEPVPALECSAGTLCHLGRCIAACNAGEERVLPCDSDSNCSSPRSACVDGFCSACGRDETCIPGLDLCRVVEDIPLPERPAADAGPRPRAPRSSRQLDGGLHFPIDAGTTPEPLGLPTTHVVMIDVAVEIDARGREAPIARSFARVDALDIRGIQDIGAAPFRIVADEPSARLLVETATQSAMGACMLSRQDLFDAPRVVRADLGTIELDNTTRGNEGLEARVKAEFVGEAYVLSSTAAPDRLLRFSTPERAALLVATGAGKAGLTLGAWPAGDLANHESHVVYELVPSPTTRERLRAPIAPHEDLVLEWERPAMVRFSPAWKVEARVEGAGHVLRCEVREADEGSGNRMVVPRVLLEEFVGLESQRGATRASLSFERREARVLAMRSRTDLDVVIRAVSRVRHTFVGEVVW